MKNSSYYKKLFLLAIILLTLFLTLQTATATDYYVDPVNGDDSNTGLDPINAFLTINKGVTSVTDPTDVINLAEGTYSTAGDRGITISQNMTIQGAGKHKTIINAQHASRIFYINNGITVNILKLTLANGTDTSNGGGTICNYGQLNVKECSFKDNTASQRGGAIRNDGTLNVANSNFSGNRAPFGGAIRNSVSALCTVLDSTFTGNNAGTSGGAIYAQGTMTVTGSTFTGNTANYAGVIYIENALFTIKGSTITGNTAKYRGGVFRTSGGTLIANYNRFYNNHARLGSVIYNSHGSVNVENNWWGTNNPIPNFPRWFRNTPAPTQWLFMTISANPTTINNGETSKITVSFNNYSQNGITSTEFTPVGSNHIPDGTPVTFATTLGNIPRTVFNTVGGIVTTTFTASQTSGRAYISGLIDSYQKPYDPNNPNTTPYTTVNINPKNVVSAKTIGMHKTGTPIITAILAFLLIISGMFYTRKQE